MHERSRPSPPKKCSVPFSCARPRKTLCPFPLPLCHSLGDPALDDVFQLFPKRLWVVGFEVERVNIFIFLRWIFCILDGSVRTPTEPFRMLSDIRMVGGALICQVQCDLHSLFPGELPELLKVLQGSQFWMGRLMAALFRSDRPRASAVTRFRLNTIIFSFSIRKSDRMNRGEVGHVKSHFGYRFDSLLTVGKGPMIQSLAARTWEKLVPGAEASSGALEIHGYRLPNSGLRVFLGKVPGAFPGTALARPKQCGPVLALEADSNPVSHILQETYKIVARIRR